MSHVVHIHAVKDAFSVDLKLVAAKNKPLITVDHRFKELVKLAHPGLLVKVLLLKGKGANAGGVTVLRLQRSDGLGELSNVNSVVIIVVDDSDNLLGQADVHGALGFDKAVNQLSSVNFTGSVSI